MRLPPGLTGWTGGTSRDRRLFADALGAELGPGDEDPTAGGVPADQLSLARDGGAGLDGERIWRQGARILAGLRGGGDLDRVRVRLGGRPALAPGEGGTRAPGSDRGGAGDAHGAGGSEGEARGGAERRRELRAVEARLAELADVPSRLRSLEERLRELRADAAEVSGDLEVGIMEWLRERQDAETQLQNYRVQARELRSRMSDLEVAGPDSPCPFCGRPLEDHLQEVTAELEDEWERLVQDGSWWRQRRDQLELKPPGLQELEGEVVRLQAAVEECAERLERCRFELREWDELRGRREELRGPDGLELPGPGEAGDEGGERARRRLALLEAFEGAGDALVEEWALRLAGRAGSLLNRITGGRILGVRVEDGGLVLLEDARPVKGPSSEDEAAVALSCHLALVLELADEGVVIDPVLVTEPFPAMEPLARQRAVELLRELGGTIPRILLLDGAGTVEAMPERFDWILDYRAERSPRPVKLMRGAVGRLRLTRRG